MSYQTKFKSHQGPHQIDGFFYEGVATHIANEKLDKEVIIICKNMEDLAYYFSRIAVGVLNPNLCKEGVYGSASKLTSVAEEKEVIEKRMYWYIHPESDCCFMEVEGYLGDGCVSELGLAVEKTVTECKILLRAEGASRSEIEKLSITAVLPDDIPF